MAKKGGYCVIGLGRFGYEVATQLNKMGKNVMVMDTNRDIIQKASKIFDVALVCDASDLNSLKETGIEGVNTVIVGISEIESNIMVCANLKELQIKEIIAKAKNSIHKRVLRTMGVSRIVIPEIEIGDRVAFQALFNIDVDIVNIGNGFSWIKASINNPFVLNKTLMELAIRTKYSATVMMIQRQGQIIFPPSNDTKFELGDVVTIMCHDSKINSILSLFVKDTNQKPKKSKKRK